MESTKIDNYLTLYSYGHAQIRHEVKFLGSETIRQVEIGNKLIVVFNMRKS